jgi:hypothetical protein
MSSLDLFIVLRKPYGLGALAARFDPLMLERSVEGAGVHYR